MNLDIAGAFIIAFLPASYYGLKDFMVVNPLKSMRNEYSNMHGFFSMRKHFAHLIDASRKASI